MIPRILQDTLQKQVQASKIVVLRGPKKSGKWTLLQPILAQHEHGVLVYDVSEKKTRLLMEDLAFLSQANFNKRIIVIREANLLQHIQELIDRCLEWDHVENLILLCSSEPALHEALWEALRQQGLEIRVSPLMYQECAQHFGLATEDQQLDQRLIYGNYPEVVAHPDMMESIVYDLVENSIITQLSAHERINKKEKLIHLLRLLAFHIGEVISFNELGKRCGLDNETVERYIRLFEKADILFTLPSFYNEHRYELKKGWVVYFVDNGIRNGLIRAFQPLEFRNDVPALWRNWVLSERRKQLLISGKEVEQFFWFTHTKQAVDYIERAKDQAMGICLQWDKRFKQKIPQSFQSLYPEIKVNLVNRSTFWSFIQKK